MEQNSYQLPQQPSSRSSARRGMLFQGFYESSYVQRFWMVIGAIFTLMTLYGALSTFLFKTAAITVVGEGVMKMKPAEVSLIVTRVNTSQDVNIAINEGEAGMKILIDTATSLVGTDAEIRKSFYQLQPSVSQDVVAGKVSPIVRYQTANAFSIKTKNVEKVNELIKSLYRDGATTISNISFTSDDKGKTEQKARELAVKDAKEKASLIAKAGGKQLGRLVSITDDNVSPTSTVGTQGADTSALTLGDMEITKRVSLVYEIW